jgi:hypothetical protein
MAPSKPHPAPVRPEPEQPERLDSEVEQTLRERLADHGPLRPWAEFEAEETRQKPQPPAPR